MAMLPSPATNGFMPPVHGPGPQTLPFLSSRRPQPFLSLLRRLASSAPPFRSAPKEVGTGTAQRKEMADAVSYEEQRRRQVEANKRKLEELQLHHLSAVVREAAAKPSPAGPSCLANGLAVLPCYGSMFFFFSRLEVLLR